MKPLFVMLVGMPGSGKSTYRDRADYGTFVHLSTDDLVEREAERRGETYDDVWEGMIKSATEQVVASFRAAIRDRQSIIWDQTNLTMKKRRGILAQVPREYLKVAVYFEVDEGLRQQRLAQRVGKTIPEHVQKSMLASYARPSFDEGFDYVLDGTLPSHSVVAA